MHVVPQRLSAAFVALYAGTLSALEQDVRQIDARTRLRRQRLGATDRELRRRARTRALGAHEDVGAHELRLEFDQLRASALRHRDGLIHQRALAPSTS